MDYSGDAVFRPISGYAHNRVDPLPGSSLALNLDISFSSPQFYSVGQLLEVRYLVTNTGTATVNGISVADAKVPAITCPVTSLPPAPRPPAPAPIP